MKPLADSRSSKATVRTLLSNFDFRTAPRHLWQGRDQIATWSGGMLREAAARRAKVLHAHGTGPGRVVATSAPTSLELLAAILGTWQCGAAVIALAEARPADAAGLRRVADGLAQLQLAVLLVEGSLPADLLSLAPVVLPITYMRLASHDDSAKLPVSHELDRPALMQRTSGSTSRAKVVPVSHRMLAANCEATAARIGVVRDDHRGVAA